MRKKLLFLVLAFATAAAAAATRPPKTSVAVNPCGPFGHRLVCGEDVFCCPASEWPACPCP